MAWCPIGTKPNGLVPIGHQAIIWDQLITVLISYLDHFQETSKSGFQRKFLGFQWFNNLHILCFEMADIVSRFQWFQQLYLKMTCLMEAYTYHLRKIVWFILLILISFVYFWTYHVICSCVV